VWLLGEQWSAKHDKEELEGLWRARPWLTYRKDFPPISNSGLTSDQGWGCMLRCGQMVVAGALHDLSLGRAWRWEDESEAELEESYLQLLSKFRDEGRACYSIHQIALMGESVDGKPVGTWFGPNLVAQVLRKLSHMDESNSLSIHVAMDNTLILSEVREACLVKTGDKELTWRPLLLFISLRLGLQEINPVYYTSLKACFSLPQSLGVIGGRPNHALYMLGCVDEEVLYLDPHLTQPAVSGQPGGMTREEAASYHSHTPGRISIAEAELDPSLSLCFLAKTEEEFDLLCINIQEKLLNNSKTPLFEMFLERPRHMFSKHMKSAGSDLSGQPDEKTGLDYEQVERVFDDDFEIIE